MVYRTVALKRVRGANVPKPVGQRNQAMTYKHSGWYWRTSRQNKAPSYSCSKAFFQSYQVPIQCLRKSNVAASALFYVKAARNVVGWSFGFKSLSVLCRREDRLLVLVVFIANYGSSALQPDFLLLWLILLQCLF